MVRVAVDLSGSEKGVREVLIGARAARNAGDLEIILVGQEAAVKGEDLSGFSFVEAPLAIPMSEKVTRELLRNPDSSLFQIVRLVKEGKADAAVSGGNTACFVALSTSILGTIPGVDRSGIAIFLPPKNDGSSTILIDTGANTATIASHLASYAVLGSYLCRAVFKTDKPRIGLLNVGAEENKGNDLYREAYSLLKTNSQINFIGNIEGHDMYGPEVDVVVVDGFTGNCILKATEGTAEYFTSLVKAEINRKGLSGDPKISEIVSGLARRADFAEYSGGFLMGVSGICIIIHGRSGAEAHRKAILRAKETVSQNLMSNLHNTFKPTSVPLWIE
ncbi:MAG: phosphate acyltransferase PlsX [Candidatus Ratteibacteria bacterium]